MEQFEEIKKEILERARTAGACTGQYKRAYQSENIETLCDVIKENFCWCCSNNVLDGELIDKYKEVFSSNKIYHNVSVTNAFLLSSGNSTVKAYGNSTVEAYGNSTVEAYGNSTVKASGNSTVKAYGNSTVEASGNSTVEASGNSTVKASGNSTVKASGNSYINCNSTIECVLKGNSIVRRWDTNTIQYVSDELKFEKI